MLILRCALVLSFLLTVAPTAQGQLLDGCDRTNKQYVRCDHTTPVCECGVDPRENTCYFCLEIEQRHTFTRYRLTQDEIQIPGFGGRVWYFNETGGFVEHPYPQVNNTPCVPDDYSNCTEAFTVDGNSYRSVIAINNRFPGPTLIVPNNSIVVVDVYNRLDSESTSIHWHGMHQRNTPWMDGVEHITQCGIAPASSFRYIFRAFPPGTHWYHSHSGAQRTDGLFGALIVRDTVKSVPGEVIDDPGNYTLTLIDWQRENSLDLFTQIHAGTRFFEQDGRPPNSNDMPFPRTCSPDGTEVGPVTFWSGLINGRGRHSAIPYNMTLLSTFTVQAGSKYRFRLVGTQSLFAYRFSIDKHRLRLIATDGHFVEPRMVDFIIIHSGERYDFVLETESNPSNMNYIIRAETLEVNITSEDPCQNSSDLLYPLFKNHSAEAILHYGDGDIPTNAMYQAIADAAMPKYMECSENKNCTAVNCPFEQFPEPYGIDCIHIHKLRLLEPITDNDALPDYTTEPTNTLFFNFGFEGDGSTSAINGRNFRFPPVPLQLAANTDNSIPTLCNEGDRKECDAPDKLVTPPCLCTHVLPISFDQTYRFVFTAVGPNRTDRANWNFAHPIHLHGHSFHVTEIGFGNYTETNRRLVSASEDIDCVNNTYICTNPSWASSKDPDEGRRGKISSTAPLKDTILIPAGGYAVVYIKSNNPGYWFLHCHIEVHQLEGMSVVINEAEDRQNAPPPNIGECSSFSWTVDMFQEKESSTGPVPSSTPTSGATTPGTYVAAAMSTSVLAFLLFIAM